jgi:hypothetical protein
VLQSLDRADVRLRRARASHYRYRGAGELYEAAGCHFILALKVFHHWARQDNQVGSFATRNALFKSADKPYPMESLFPVSFS